MHLLKILNVYKKFYPALALSLLAITLNACASSDGAKESSGTFESPLDGMYPRTVGDWSDVMVTAIALCHPNDYWVIRVDGLATGGDGQSLDRYIEGIVRPDGVIVRPKAYYLENPGPYCPGEGGPSVSDAVGIPDVVKGARQTAWIWFEGIRDFITAEDLNRLALILTDTGYSGGNRSYIRPWISPDARIETGVSASPEMSGKIESLMTMADALGRYRGDGECRVNVETGVDAREIWERKLFAQLPENSENVLCSDVYLLWFPTDTDLWQYLESAITGADEAAINFQDTELRFLGGGEPGILIGFNGIVASPFGSLSEYERDWGKDHWIRVSNWAELTDLVCLLATCPYDRWWS